VAKILTRLSEVSQLLVPELQLLNYQEIYVSLETEPLESFLTGAETPAKNIFKLSPSAHRTPHLDKSTIFSIGEYSRFNL